MNKKKKLDIKLCHTWYLSVRTTSFRKTFDHLWSQCHGLRQTWNNVHHEKRIMLFFIFFFLLKRVILLQQFDIEHYGTPRVPSTKLLSEIYNGYLSFSKYFFSCLHGPSVFLLEVLCIRTTRMRRRHKRRL